MIGIYIIAIFYALCVAWAVWFYTNIEEDSQ